MKRALTPQPSSFHWLAREEKAADAIVGAISRAVKEKIDALVQAQPAQRVTPGIAVAISKNGRTIYENTAGERDVSSHAPMLITTPQAIGSITKQFTAAGILLLQQEKKLWLDNRLFEVPSRVRPRRRGHPASDVEHGERHFR